jgi:hypothetical protein
MQLDKSAAIDPLATRNYHIVSCASQQKQAAHVGDGSFASIQQDSCRTKYVAAHNVVHHTVSEFGDERSGAAHLRGSMRRPNKRANTARAVLISMITSEMTAAGPAGTWIRAIERSRADYGEVGPTSGLSIRDKRPCFPHQLKMT